MAAVGTLGTHQYEGGARIELPRRVLPVTLRQFARGALLLGSGLFLAGVAPVFWGAHAPLWLYLAAATFALPPLAFGLLILGGRSSVDCTGGQLVVREKVGPLTYRRTYQADAIRRLEVEVLTFNLGGKAEGGFQSTESITILAADTAEHGRRVLLFGYPAPLLEQVITELRRRSGWAAPHVTGPGKR